MTNFEKIISPMWIWKRYIADLSCGECPAFDRCNALDIYSLGECEQNFINWANDISND